MNRQTEDQGTAENCAQSKLVRVDCGVRYPVVTCVYCGMEYPAGTPAHGGQVQALTDHIKVCPKHPMREAEVTIVKLRSALAGLVGVDGKEELEQMELMIRAAQVPERDKMVTLNAVHTLLDTLST